MTPNTKVPEATPARLVNLAFSGNHFPSGNIEEDDINSSTKSHMSFSVRTMRSSDLMAAQSVHYKHQTKSVRFLQFIGSHLSGDVLLRDMRLLDGIRGAGCQDNLLGVAVLLRSVTPISQQT